MTVCTIPELLNSDEYPADVKDRAKRILSTCVGNTIGSYADISGIDAVKEYIAEYIRQRDGGIYTDVDNIFITSGASDAIRVN